MFVVPSVFSERDGIELVLFISIVFIFTVLNRHDGSRHPGSVEGKASSLSSFKYDVSCDFFIDAF